MAVLRASCLIVGLAAMVLFAGAAVLGADVPISWSSIAPLSLPRHSGAVVEADGLLYVIGGIEYGNQILVYGQTYEVTSGTLVEAYDPASGAWERLADLPYPINMMAQQAEGRQWSAAAAYAGSIYLFGGANLNGDVRDTIDVYDIASDTWTAGVAVLPEPVCAMSAATIGDRIYLFGGTTGVDPYSPQDYLAACYVFDPVTRTVSSIASMPIARFKTTAIPLDDRILVLGGISATVSANAQVYDVGKNEWTRLEPVFWERRFWGGAEIDGAMFLVGGRDEHTLSSTSVDVYVPEFGTWLTGEPMMLAREDAFVVAIDGDIYVIGGRNNEGVAFAEGEIGTPDLANASAPSPSVEDPEAEIVWSEEAPMSTPRYSGATSVHGGIIYTIGGLEEAEPTGQVCEAYDPKSDTWGTLASLPEGRFNMSALALDGTIYVFGGADVTGSVTDTVFAYDIASDSWTTAGRLPNAVAGMSSTVHEGEVYLFGGSHSSQLFVPKENYFSAAYVFDPESFTFEELPPMPVARNMALACSVEDSLFVIGGMKSPGATANQRYWPRNRTWTIQAEMPVARGGHTGVVVHTMRIRGIYVIGGANQADIYAYNWFDDEWFVVHSLLPPRNFSFTSVVASSPERIYVIGGVDETGTVVDHVWISEPLEE